MGGQDLLQERGSTPREAEEEDRLHRAAAGTQPEGAGAVRADSAGPRSAGTSDRESTIATLVLRRRGGRPRERRGRRQTKEVPPGLHRRGRRRD